MEKSLLVEPAGAMERINRGFLLDLTAKPQIMENITIDIPKNAIPESAMIEVSVVGDLVGSAIKNVENLIQLPVGCGEQTMVNFVPNIMVLRYLQVCISSKRIHLKALTEILSFYVLTENS